MSVEKRTKIDKKLTEMRKKTQCRSINFSIRVSVLKLIETYDPDFAGNLKLYATKEKCSQKMMHRVFIVEDNEGMFYLSLKLDESYREYIKYNYCLRQFLIVFIYKILNRIYM